MDLHPTPFPAPGKRRPTAQNHPTKKDRDRNKPSDQPISQTRPKRAFGVARNTNIPLERPPNKPKPWKPSGNATTKATDALTAGSSDKSRKSSIVKKNQHVCFREPATETALIGDGVCTPVSAVKAVVTAETPYLSAENCSKCRFDRMETTSYWMSQIKIAEAVGRHSVSASFFRLALECHAQPFLSLRRELKHYVARHEAASLEALWGDLCEAYGLSNDHSNADPCGHDEIDGVLVEKENLNPNTRDEVNCETLKDEGYEFDIIDNPPLLDALEDDPNVFIDTGFAEFVNGKAIKEPSEKKSPEGDVSEKKSCIEKPKFQSLVDSPSSTTTRNSAGFAGEGQDTSNQRRSWSKVSGGKPARINAAGARVRQNSQLRNQSKEDEKGNNLSSEGTGNDLIANQEKAV